MNKITKLLGVIFCTTVCASACGMRLTLLRERRQDTDIIYFVTSFLKKGPEYMDFINFGTMREKISYLKNPETREEIIILKNNLQSIVKDYFLTCPPKRSMAEVCYLSVMADRIEEQLEKKGLLPHFYRYLKPIINNEFVTRLEQFAKIENPKKNSCKNMSQTRSGTIYVMQQ